LLPVNQGDCYYFARKSSFLKGLTRLMVHMVY
jgi:hypothetical protein